MAIRRTAVVDRLAQLVGPSLHIVDPGKGWPAIAEMQTSVGPIPLSMFVAPVILGHREYDEDERRVQNPGKGKPIIIPPSTVPVVLGLWLEDEHETVATPVLMAADAWRRQGLMTRHSVFVRLPSLLTAMQHGWDSRKSEADELITCFWPSRLAEHVEQVLLPTFARASAEAGTKLLAPESDADNVSLELLVRERRLTQQLVRDARFGARVLDAYGSRCSLCDLNLGLVQAAHIYPAAAPGSCDELWNGVSLCANHHVAFDRHYISIDPETRVVRLHPWLLTRMQTNQSCERFVASTLGVLKEPKVRSVRPRPEMFRRRYDFFGSSYDWADPSKETTDA